MAAYPRRWEMMVATTIRLNPMRKPGRMPAANNWPMEAPVRKPKMIMGIEGGMTTPMEPPEAWTAAAKSESYPDFFMAGIRMEPTAAASAAAEPEIPAKNMALTTVTAARPPGSQPTRALARSMMRWLMPPASMSTPVYMNRGTARRWKESHPAYILCTTIIREKSPWTRMAVTAEMPMARAMGVLTANRNKRVSKRTSAVTRIPPFQFAPEESRGVQGQKQSADRNDAVGNPFGQIKGR